MKALQQAAQNRSGRPPSADDGTPAPGAGSTLPEPSAAAATASGIAGPGPGSGASADSSLAELSLEPINDRPGATRAPARSPASAGRPATARATAGGQSDRRTAPRWSGDLQNDERAERPDASAARAGAVLAAGTGAARAGALSRMTRMHWIIAGGSLAGVLLFAYFYIQISHPGLLQRGLRQPAIGSPLASRTPPPAPAAVASASGTLDPAGGSLSVQQAAGNTPAVPATAGPTTAAAAPAQVPAAVPGALAASPLLNPPAGAAPAGPAAPSTALPAPAAAAAPGTMAPQAAAATVAAQPGVSSALIAATPAADATPSTASPASAAAAGIPRPSTATAAVRAPLPPPAGEGIRISRGSSANPVNPALADAYDHLQAGRIESAQRLYEQVAAADPRNVDALLGMGAVAQLGNQVEVASRLYMRVLEIDPRNAHAQAALIGQLGRADPVAAESQLKTLIAREPSPFLFFTLGNLYADQNRWPQAQQAWFQAHHMQPGNADYAFNLAVSLERISQPRLAIDYLRTAIRLAETGARANFDVAAARKRVALLESAGRTP